MSLPLKKQKKIRKALADLAHKKKKMKDKSKTAGLTKENQTELENDLNAISVEIQKVKLEKRTQVEK